MAHSTETAPPLHWEGGGGGGRNPDHGDVCTQPVAISVLPNIISIPRTELTLGEGSLRRQVRREGRELGGRGPSGRKDSQKEKAVCRSTDCRQCGDREREHV